MPLVATYTGRKTTGSVDTTDGLQSRRESASSIYSEFSGLDGMEETLDPSERSASPLPPNLSSLNSPSSDGSGRRKSTLSNKDFEDRRSPEAVDRSEIRKDNASPAVKGGSLLEVEQPPAVKKKPNTVLLAGVVGYGACCTIDDTRKVASCQTTHHGAIVVERLTKGNSLQALGKVMVLECGGFKVRYRAHEETNNWLWGDVVWRSFEAYGAALRMSKPDESRSLYALLCDKNTIHRRVYAGLLEEALQALRWQKVELMDPVSSPFGLSFRAARAFLLLPKPVFPIALRILLALRFPLQARVKDDAPYCDTTSVHRYMAPFLNGEVVRIGFEGEVQTPLNQEVLEMLSTAAKQQANNGPGSSPSTRPRMIEPVCVPKLYSMTFFTSVLSCLVLLLAIIVRFVLFVIDVTFFW